MLGVFSIMLFFPAGRMRNGHLVGIIGWYLAAKILELLDGWVYGWGGLVSGHSMKHLAAAMSALWMLRAVTSWPPVHNLSEVSPPRAGERLSGSLKNFVSVSERLRSRLTLMVADMKARFTSLFVVPVLLAAGNGCSIKKVALPTCPAW